MTTEEFKSALLEYIASERQHIEADIEAHANLSESDKIAEGYLVKDARVTSCWGTNCYDLVPTINQTRLRPGDHAQLVGYRHSCKVDIIENGLDVISIHCESKLQAGERYDLHVTEAYLLEPLTKVLEQCSDGTPGYSYLSMLAGEIPVSVQGMFPLPEFLVPIYTEHQDEDQQECCRKIAMAPSIHCMQGPPGTGKTRTLAAAANMVSSQGNQILIIALTHQAVNNALNQIRALNPTAPIIKVGDTSKAQKLDSTIDVHTSMHAYNASLTSVNRNGKKTFRRAPQGLIIGMTYHAALINFGLQHPRSVLPTFLFVDEASQIPLSYASILGTFGISSVCLFGDSRQMPPIFHSALSNSPLSVSILDHASALEHVPTTVLHTTYRMNQVITELVSRKFYEPHGITLRTRNLIPCSADDIVWHDSTALPRAERDARESNTAEARAIAREVSNLVLCGTSMGDIAVITPWRRQVLNLRVNVAERLMSVNGHFGPLPLIDTVERLQGQDVDTIILSFATTDERYFYDMESFLLNPNRLNVMLSRAKSRVIVYCSPLIWEQLDPNC